MQAAFCVYAVRNKDTANRIGFGAAIKSAGLDEHPDLAFALTACSSLGMERIAQYDSRFARSTNADHCETDAA